MRISLLFFISFFLCSCKSKLEQKNDSYQKDSETSLVKEENNSTPTVSTEEYKHLDFSAINQKLKDSNGRLTPLEIMRLYYPYNIESNEGNEKIEMKEYVIENGNTIITLVHDNQLDDSVKGVKYKMELEKMRNNSWIVISLAKNWQCWPNRGHSSWGIDLCN